MISELVRKTKQNGLEKLLSRKRVISRLVPPAMVIMLATLASKALGMAREVIFATKFGAPNELQAYLAAFQLPDLLTRVFVMGAFSSAFIPMFASYLEKNKQKEAWKLADVVTTLLMLILVVCSLVLFIIAPLVVPLLAPGFDAETRHFTVIFLRIMLLSPLFLGMSNVLTGILNSHHRFTASAFAPVIYNAGIIWGALFFEPMFGIVWGLGLGVALGAFLHFAIQIYPAVRLGYRFRLNFDFNFEGVKEVIKLAIPRMIGLGVAQLDMFVDVILGSFLASGSIVLLNYANRLQTMPVGIFGLAFATASFPFFAQRFAKKDTKGFNEILFKNLRHVFFFTIPFSIALIIMRVEVVRLLYGQTGKLDWFQTRSIAFAVALYSISIFAQSANYVLNRAFYAMQDTKTPVVAGVVSVILNSLLSLILVFTVNHFSMLALSFTIASMVNMVLLLALLYAKLGGFQIGSFVRSVFVILWSSAIMGAVMLLLELWLSAMMDLSFVSNLLLESTICLVVGGAIYLTLTQVFGSEELHWFERFVQKGEFD